MERYVDIYVNSWVPIDVQNVNVIYCACEHDNIIFLQRTVRYIYASDAIMYFVLSRKIESVHKNKKNDKLWCFNGIYMCMRKGRLVWQEIIHASVALTEVLLKCHSFVVFCAQTIFLGTILRVYDGERYVSVYAVST